MESAGKDVSSRTSELRQFVPSVVQPSELSRRQDSSTLAFLGEGAKGRHADGKAVIGDRPKLRGADEKRVDEAAAWISAKVASTLRKGAEDVGEYVLDAFFSSDPELAKSRNPHKSASYRALAAKCGTPELPISKTWLNNAVGIALMLRRLPEATSAFRALPPSYQETLLPLGDPDKVERVAKQVATGDLTCKELRRVVAEQRGKARKSDGRERAAAPSILKKISRSAKALGLDGNKRWFSKADVEELDAKQKKAALESAEALIEKLKDLVVKLKKA